MSQAWLDTPLTVPEHDGKTSTTTVGQALASMLIKLESARPPPGPGSPPVPPHLDEAIAATQACQLHDVAPPSGPPALWPNCQTLDQHKAYVVDAWSMTFGVGTGVGSYGDYARIKAAMDHGGMGGGEPGL